MDGEDRLSALGDDLLRHILHFVPSKEAASTSVLSRRWGSLWRSSGAVNLVAQINDGQRDDVSSIQQSFVRAAGAALAAAEAPVRRLTLRVVDASHGYGIDAFLYPRGPDWRVEADVAGDVVSHHAARHAEELRVTVLEPNDAFLLSDPSEINPMCSWRVRFTSLPSSGTLRVLDLTRCALDLPPPVAFPRLATLRLRLSSVDPKSLEALCDAAPELAAVHLEWVSFTGVDLEQDQVPQGYDDQSEPESSDDSATSAAREKLAVVRLSFQTLTSLVLASCGVDANRRKTAMEIDAPRLRSFVYKGMIRRFVLRSAPAPGVARVDLHFLNGNPYVDDGERTRMLFWHFLRNFSNSKTLKLTVHSGLKAIANIGKARCAKLLCAFRSVERLELEGVHHPASKTAAVAIANLLDCCPVLGDFTLKLSTVPHRSTKGDEYGSSFLGRKYRLDYNKSIDRFKRRNRRSKTAVSMEDASGGRHDDAPDIPGLTGRSFACLQRSLRRVSLQFRLDSSSSSSSCLGVRLVKFFAENAMVLEELCVDTGNRRLYEHCNFSVGKHTTPYSAKVGSQHENLAESSRRLLPLQRRARLTAMLDPL